MKASKRLKKQYLSKNQPLQLFSFRVNIFKGGKHSLGDKSSLHNKNFDKL